MASPSGEQIEIAFGDQRAVVVEVGGGLRSYSVAGRDAPRRLRRRRDGRRRAAGRCSSRGRTGSRTEATSSTGARHQLPLTEPEARNAIHGLVRWAAWATAEREPIGSCMEHMLAPAARLSVHARARHRVRPLRARACRVTTTAPNVGREACPYGCGQHPYLTLGTATVDTLQLHAPGRTRAPVSDERGIPVSAVPVDGTEYDFRAARTDRRDEARQRLHRSRARRRRAAPASSFGDPDSGAALTLWVGRELPLPAALHR